MPRFIKRTSEKIGLSPGALAHIGERKQEHTRISVMNYDEDRFEVQDPEDMETVFALRDTPATARNRSA